MPLSCCYHIIIFITILMLYYLTAPLQFGSQRLQPQLALCTRCRWRLLHSFARSEQGVYIYIYMYVYIYIYIYTHTYTCIVNTCVCIYIYIYTYVSFSRFSDVSRPVIDVKPCA